MTREFFKRLQIEFPSEGENPEYRLWKFNFEQFRVTKLGRGFIRPTLQEVVEIAHTTLKRVKTIYQITNIAYLQATEKDDIIIIPGYQVNTQHALAINDMDERGDGRAILFSTSWHSPYSMTPKQMDRYINFTKAFFEKFGSNCHVPKWAK